MSWTVDEQLALTPTQARLLAIGVAFEQVLGSLPAPML